MKTNKRRAKKDAYRPVAGSPLRDLAESIAEDLFGGANRLVCEEQGETINRRGWSKKCMADRISNRIHDALMLKANAPAEIQKAGQR